MCIVSEIVLEILQKPNLYIRVNIGVVNNNIYYVVWYLKNAAQR